jgi:long-chain acyl-CoA synthetase
VAYVVATKADGPETTVVRLSHDNLLAASRAVAEAFPLTDEDRALSRMPILQVARRPWHAALVSRGVTLVFGDPGTPAHEELDALSPTLIIGEGDDLDELLHHLVTKVTGGSPLARLVLAWSRRKHLRAARRDLDGDRLPDRPVRGATLERIHRAAGGRLRWIISVAQPLAANRLMSWLGTGFPVLEGIGTASTTGVLCQNLPAAVRMGSSGRVLPGSALRVDEAGQIWVRGPIVEQARSPGSERRVADRSWFRTDLVGNQDDGGYITVV